MAVTPPPLFTLRQLAYLVAAADTGTIVAAATELHVSASAVSDAITELERALGARLCVRRRAQGVTLTSAGARVVQDGRLLLRASRETESAIRAPAGELVGPIAVACYPTLSPIVLPPLLRDFAAQHPGVDLHVRELTQDQLEGRFESGEVDVAFVYETLIPGHPHRATLYKLPAHVLLSPSHPLAGADSVRFEDLIDDDLILYDAPPSSDHTLGMFAERGLTPRVRYRTSSFEAVRTLVGRGIGYGILVQRPLNPASYEGTPLVMKEIDPPVTPVGIDVVWSADLEPPERVRALIRFARSVDWPGADLSEASPMPRGRGRD